RSDQGGAVPARQGVGKPHDASQVRGGARQRFGYGEERVIADDPERRPVLLGRDRLTPGVQLPQGGQLPRRQGLAPFDAQKPILSYGSAGPPQVFEAGELLLCPSQPTERQETRSQRLAKRGQVLSVGRGVREHRRG